MLQNRSSTTESTHANTEASVSGHGLDSGGKSMKRVSKNEGIFQSQEENWTWNFLPDGNEFAAKTEFRIVLEYFCKIEVGLKKFLSRKARTRKAVELEIVCPSEKGEGE